MESYRLWKGHTAWRVLKGGCTPDRWPTGNQLYCKALLKEISGAYPTLYVRSAS